MENQNKWYVVINPLAGNGKAKEIWVKYEKHLTSKGIETEIVWTEFSGHATLLTIEGVRKGFKKILGVGGDGTNHEIINGIIQQNAIESREIWYTLLPIGTGNDWARYWKLNRKKEELERRLTKGVRKVQDIGVISFYRGGIKESRYFVNVAGIGYDAYVVRLIQENRGLIKGKLGYIQCVLRALPSYKPMKGRIVSPGKQDEEGNFFTINAGITKYSGGGMQITPHAIPDDSLLALTWARDIVPMDVVLNVVKFFNGKLLYPKVFHDQRERLVVEHIDAPFPVEADGEFLGYTPAEMWIKPGVLTIVV